MSSIVLRTSVNVAKATFTVAGRPARRLPAYPRMCGPSATRGMVTSPPANADGGEKKRAKTESKEPSVIESANAGIEKDSKEENTTAESPKLRMMPHSRSSLFWQRVVEKASDAVKAKIKEDNKVVVYIASSSASPTSFLLEADSKGHTSVDESRDGLVQFCSAKGYEVHDLGSGPQGSKAAELSRAIANATQDKQGQSSKENTSPRTRGIFLTGASSHTGAPLTSIAAQAVSLIANKHRGVNAAVCHDVQSAKVSRSLLATNVLVMTGDETMVQETVDGWIGQGVSLAPRSAVGEIPEWWPDDDDSVKGVVDDYLQSVGTAEEETRG